ncbi:MBL fold metallo-hydrolase [Bacillus aerolatus]|uniref:MBL fold metallo-hydrolase n=1 Tax=Bacillus aerolatus TaxID=2653354 RepID=A0A6I1FUT6_9BACI|nr:MBL fold metallo-hydrolase [Bacillus aerolatus]KAB7706483.1 MBL fold metallo-hydrolase [Bacillus aerolatus]
MFFRSYFDEKLAQYSYMVACQKTGEAIVIDPARDITPYVETARKEGFQLTAAAETHIHADFVSGARQLANDYGVTLYLSDEGDENWKYQYTDNLSAKLVKDGDVFMIGNVEFKVMHTPGHTPESISFILTDKGGGSEEPMGIFTGDFVFVGDVGRPDLLEKAAGVKGTADSGASQMFDSVQKFKQLPDYLIVWPGHGAGSACGKSLGAVPISTVGYEKANNWALKEESKEEFQKELLKDQPEPPKYFAVMKKVNKIGPSVLANETIPYEESLDGLEKYLNQDDVIVIDTRNGSEFAQGHIEGTINLPYTKIFTNWAGWILDYDKKLVIIAEKEQTHDIQHSLESIGLDKIAAFASPRVVSEVPSLEKYANIDVKQLKAQYEKDDVYVIDIRQQQEWEAGHIPTAHHHMLGYLEEAVDSLPKDKKIIVHCQSGARSAIGTSLLQANGFKNIENLASGFAGWKKENGPIEKA